MINTYPLKSITVEEAKELQFKIIDCVTTTMKGSEILSLGDLGVVKGQNKPTMTIQIEKVFAKVFDGESAIFVRGSGTGAIRWALMSFLKPGDTILVHEAPIYPTTKTTVEYMGLNIVTANFNDIEDIKKVISKNENIKGAIVQLTRQKIDDSYDLEEVIRTIKECNSNIKVVTDDNYAALKVNKIGIQCGADLSTFSCYKLLGPEGVGVVIGKEELTDKIYKMNYSGGSQVQGFEAMEALRGIIYAPVSLAISSEVSEEIITRLNNGELKGVKGAFIANAQSKVVLVEFEKEIANEIIEIAEELGAAPHPVGSESKYEFAPMVYRVSGTFRQSDPTLEKRMIRINPMRSGANTVIRILKTALGKIENN